MANTVEIVLKGVDHASGVTNAVKSSLTGLATHAQTLAGKVGSLAGSVGSLGSGLAGALGKATGAVGGLVDGLGRVGLAIYGLKTLGQSVADLATGLVAGNAEFERYSVQFEVLLGSADKAKQRLADLAKFGAETPFELPEVVRADKILQSFGFHSEETARQFGRSGEEIRRIAGDVAAGTGAGFEQMALLLGKFSSGATGEAIMRMSELGITTRAELAKMGLEFDKSGALLSPLPQAMTVVLSLMEQKFGGMMDAQSSTFEGMVSNLQDWMDGAKRIVMQPLFEVLKDRLAALLAVLNTPAAQHALERIAQQLAHLLDVGMRFVTGERLAATFNGIMAVARPTGQVLATLAPVVANLAQGAMRLLAEVMERVGPLAQRLAADFQRMLPGLVALGSAVREHLAAAFDLARGVFARLAPLATSVGAALEGMAARAAGPLAVLRTLIIEMGTFDPGLALDRLAERSGLDLGPLLAPIRGLLDALKQIPPRWRRSSSAWPPGTWPGRWRASCR